MTAPTKTPERDVVGSGCPCSASVANAAHQPAATMPARPRTSGTPDAGMPVHRVMWPTGTNRPDSVLVVQDDRNIMDQLVVCDALTR